MRYRVPILKVTNLSTGQYSTYFPISHCSYTCAVLGHRHYPADASEHLHHFVEQLLVLGFVVAAAWLNFADADRFVISVEDVCQFLGCQQVLLHLLLGPCVKYFG